MALPASIVAAARLQAQRLAALKSSASFLEYMWPELTGGRPLTMGRHIRVVCDALDRLHRGEIPGNILVINIPPRSLKSTIVSVAHPAWTWLHKPHEQFLSLSCVDTVATRDARDMRLLVESPKYLDLMRLKAQLDLDAGLIASMEEALWAISDDQNTKTTFSNTRRGHRIALPTGANVIGLGGDTLIIDDPIDVKLLAKTPAALSDALSDVQTNFESTWKSRRNDGNRSRIVLIMQRLHERDLAGYVLENEQHAAHEAIILPTEYDPEIACRFDWRTTPGELLIPERVNREDIEPYKKNRPLDYAAQHGQRPTPAKGGKFDLDNWRYYADHPVDAAQTVLAQGGVLVGSIDCASKTGSENDFTAMYLVGAVPASAPRPSNAPGAEALPYGALFPPRSRVVLHEVHGKFEIDTLIQRTLAFVSEWPWMRKLVIEDAANGTALIQTLRNLPTSDGPFLDDDGRPLGFPHHRVEIVSHRPGANKQVRADFTATYQRIGLVYLPAGASWSHAVALEHQRFPRGAHDDRVDALSQAHVYLEDPENVPKTAKEAVKALGFLRDLAGTLGF